MYSNSERNYFDYATDSTTQMQKLVSDCRDWKNQCTDLTSKEIIKRYIEKIYNADKNTITDDYGKGLEYVMGLVRDILATVIEEDNKINNTAIELIFKEFQPIDNNSFKSNKLDELKKFCKNVIDTKRIKRNHEIISKRYNLKELLRKEFLIGDRRERHYHTPFIFSICRKLDTYNLELPEKINLMCEELAYLLDHEYRYAYIVDRDELRNEDIRFETLKDIVPGVMTYILGTYSTEGIPEDVLNKVITAAASKVTNSSFFNANRIENSNVNYFNSIMNSNSNENFFSRLAKVQRNGTINNKQGLLNFIFNSDIFFDLDKLYYYVIYFYAIFTPTFETFNISLRKTINALITDTIEKSKTDSIESQLYKVKTAFKVTLKTIDGKALANKEITFSFNNKVIKVKTDANGIAKFSFNLNKAAKYPVSVAFLGDKHYKGAFTTATITVNPIKTKITAPKKTFKKSKKVKKVVITLKNSKGKALAKKKITLTVNKKKYTVKTNSKGKATFKIKNLKKKGTFKYTVKFAGDSLYKAVQKKGKIKVK